MLSCAFVHTPALSPYSSHRIPGLPTVSALSEPTRSYDSHDSFVFPDLLDRSSAAIEQCAACCYICGMIQMSQHTGCSIPAVRMQHSVRCAVCKGGIWGAAYGCQNEWGDLRYRELPSPDNNHGGNIVVLTGSHYRVISLRMRPNQQNTQAMVWFVPLLTGLN
jgi:hypothetical protein